MMAGFLYNLGDSLRQRGRRRHMNPEHALGRRGEDIAHRFLQRAGIVVVARNYRPGSSGGEIDLVGWDREALVFIEVKSRRSDEYGAPDRAIGDEKRRRIVRVARDYARRAEAQWDKVRFDVVNVVFSSPPAVTHMRDVFRPPR